MKTARISKPKILRVVIEHRQDESPDTSWLGAYSTTAQSEYAIDRVERGDCGHGEYRWFNPPVENYTGTSEAEIRKYCEQDYQRMERLQRGDWYFLGIVAKAEVHLAGSYVVQRITSGGLWGIESDAPEYHKEIEREELSSLKTQLQALGCGKAAIARAFANAETVSR